MKLRDDIDELLPGMIADRRHLHQHPELAFQEFETARFVADRLVDLGVEEIRTGIAGTGVTGIIRGANDGPTLLLRADMDALPINEETGADYASKTPDVMHACGHDAHTAILLAVARLLMDRRDEFSGSVKLCFQPAEEVPPGGAIQMIEAGVLDGVDAAFALHVAADDPVGTVRCAGGPAMAGGDLFVISVQGRGGHAASPDEAIDPVGVASHIAIALQTIVSRGVDPMANAVVTIGTISAGDAFNVIPDTATMGGTFRYFDVELGKRIEQRITEIATGVAAAYGATASVQIPRGYPPTINHAGMTGFVRMAAIDAVGGDHLSAIDPKMGGEDFAHVLLRVPGSYFLVGAGNEERGITHGLHHPKFDIDEQALAIGAEVMAGAAVRYLTQKGEA